MQAQHGTKHVQDTGHPLMQSYEPGEDWFWDCRTEEVLEGPELAPPHQHPADQPTPGPAGAVPVGWRSKIN